MAVHQKGSKKSANIDEEKAMYNFEGIIVSKNVH